MSDQRDIPLPIQREVRQRCGFGCVICGFPIYEYEHMLEWAEVKRHIASEITLLCDRHHREKTSGLLPKEIVINANDMPYNIINKVSSPYNLCFYGNQAEIVIGNISFVAEDKGYGTEIVPLLIDSTPIIGIILADNHFLLNLVIFDEYNKLILHIRNNELKYKVDVWDINLVARTLTIRQALRNILIEIEFITPNKVFIKRGRFLCNGVEFIISEKEGLLLNNNKIGFSDITLISQIGIIVGENRAGLPSIFGIENVKRYGR
ncbi:hypothetical protein [Myroides injenensis]|uniref:hypothetical protein n=1 Tax=Myroides injenensis TaxID=1183151 RepID=UPI0002889EED|nr:hypothetical protein [Myroides injenensis]